MKREDRANNKYLSVAESFFRIEGVYDTEIIERSFNTIFDLIPEAEKGSYYELKDESFVPLLSKGYDLNLLRLLEFSSSDLFIGFKGATGKSLDNYIVNVEKRDESKFSAETIDVFKIK